MIHDYGDDDGEQTYDEHDNDDDTLADAVAVGEHTHTWLQPWSKEWDIIGEARDAVSSAVDELFWYGGNKKSSGEWRDHYSKNGLAGLTYRYDRLSISYPDLQTFERAGIIPYTPHK